MLIDVCDRPEFKAMEHYDSHTNHGAKIDWFWSHYTPNFDQQGRHIWQKYRTVIPVKLNYIFVFATSGFSVTYMI